MRSGDAKPRTAVTANAAPGSVQATVARGRRALLLAGATSSVLYVAGIDVFAALLHPDYHDYTSQMVSELLAFDAPTRPLLLWLFVPYNLLLLGFAAGVWLSARTNRAAHLAGIMLLGYAALSAAGLVLFPMDVRGTLHSTRDGPHIVATIVMSVFIMATMACGAFVHGRRFLVYSFATLAVVIAFGVAASLLARPMPGPTPWIGIAERVNIYASMVWMAVFAFSLWNGPSPARTAEP